MYYRPPVPWPIPPPTLLDTIRAEIAAPLEARITALEAENARLTELTNILIDYVTWDHDSRQAHNRLIAMIAERKRKKQDVGP